MSEISKAVILAAGLGKRMRKAQGGDELDATQAQAAQRGHKALMPLGGRIFLDYVLSAVADAGYRRVCLVIGPAHDEIRDYYTRQVRPRRLTVEFAVQPRPMGTADALAAAEPFAAGEGFLLINSDNYYPVEALAALRRLEGPGLAGFDRQALLDTSNIAPDRIARFAVLTLDADSCLARIIEKPDPADLASVGPDVCVSMNCWRFDASIFASCRAIPLSPRGEYEIPAAVEHSMHAMGRRYRVLPFRSSVLDLSSRQDILPVAQRLAGLHVEL